MMQSNITHSGGPSHLFASIQTYLSSHNRAQPIIGLDSVTELCTHTEPPVYLCEVCVLKLNKTDIKTHIMGSLHRYNYIRARHVSGLKAGADLTSLAWRLMELAKVVEKQEGTGTVQVLHLDEVLYTKMLSQPALDVLAQMKEIKKQSQTSEVQSAICHNLRKSGHCSSRSLAVNRSATARNSTWALTQGSNDHTRHAPSQSRCHSPKQTLPGKNVQSPFRWMHERILHADGNTTFESSARTLHKARKPGPQTCKIPSECPNPTRVERSSRAFTSDTAPRSIKWWSPIRAPVNNNLVHADSPQTLTTTQQTSPKIISCQNMNILKLMRTAGITGTSASDFPQDQDQDRCLNNPSIQEPFMNTHWLLNSSNVEQEEEQLRPCTPEGVHISKYKVTQSQSEEQTCIVHPPESPESYTGTKPLIGLQGVIKCQSVDGDPPPCCYLCRLCSLKVLKSDIIHHLTSSQHQLNYTTFNNTHPMVGMSKCQSLQSAARHLDQKECRGQMKVMRLSACLFSEVLEQDFHWCMKMLNCGSTDEITPKHGPLLEEMEGNSMTSGHKITLKRRKKSKGTTLGHTDAGNLVPRNKRRSRKKRAGLKKKANKQPVFKVSLSMMTGPVVVDRMPLVTTTVAPEIECQSPEAIYDISHTFSDKHITSGNHTLTPEHAHIYHNPETFQNPELYSTELWQPEGSMHSLAYADPEKGMSKHEYVNINQFPEYSGTFLSGTSYGFVACNSFVSNCPSEGLSTAHNVNDNIGDRQPIRNNVCVGVMERNPSTQQAGNWPEHNSMFIQSDVTQVTLVTQGPQQMLGERNYELMNWSTNMYPATMRPYVPAFNAYTSHPVQYMSQTWMYGGAAQTGFGNPYPLNQF